jgi:hypothetical protein
VKRISKLGLAAFVALSLTAAIGASGASASSFVTEKAPATISGAAAGVEGIPKFSFLSGSMSCSSLAPSGAMASVYATEIDGSLKESACTGPFSAPYTLQTYGCSLRLKAGNDTLDVVCPAGKEIRLVPVKSGCEVTIPAQSGLPAGYGTEGSGSAREIRAEIGSSLKYSQVNGSCTKGTFTGSVNAKWNLKGTYEGSQVGVYVAKQPISIGGATPKLIAGSYPATISGSQVAGLHKFALNGGAAECKTADISSIASEATAQLTVQATYADCTVLGIAGSVKMNGCTYTFNVLNQPPVGSTYAGHADIACPAGKAIELVAGTSKVKCTVSIGTQTTDSGGLSFTNEASSTIGLGLAVKGIDYHKQQGEGLGACSTGDFTDGTYTGSSTLVGS